MPTFTYECKSCGMVFDKFMKMSENDLPEKEKCLQCGEMKVEQIISTVPLMGDPVHLGIRQLPSEWKRFLRKLKKDNPGSNFNTHS